MQHNASEKFLTKNSRPTPKSRHSVALPCLQCYKSNQLNLWSNADLGCPNPEPINMKFGVGDYVGAIAPHAKIQIDRPSGSVPVYG